MFDTRGRHQAVRLPTAVVHRTANPTDVEDAFDFHHDTRVLAMRAAVNRRVIFGSVASGGYVAQDAGQGFTEA